jgi:FkbM family methyltransferase
MSKLFLRKLLPEALVYAGKRFFYHFFKATDKLYSGPIDKYDFQTYDILKKILTPTSNCIDIGCNTGQILKPIVQLASQGIHYAFEPIPNLHKKLVKRFSKVHVLDVAVCNEVGNTTFNYFPERPTFSGIKERDYYNENYKAEKITVATNKLDNIIPKDIKIDLIKIDVEGAEYEVLKGASETIARNKPLVIFEFGADSAKTYGFDVNDVFDYFDTKGLQLSSLELYLKGLQPFTKVEFVGQFTKGYNYYFIAYPI